MKRVAGLLAAALVAGCAAQQPACAPPAVAAPVVELFLGRGLPEGGEVSEAAWQNFLAEVVTPRFPDGLSVVDAAGQWRQGGALGRERSKLLIIAAPGASDLEPRLAAVIEAWKTRFQQRTVLRVDRTACVSLR